MSNVEAIAPMAVSPDEAGRITSHSRTAIYQAIASGTLPSFKSGKRRLILLGDLETWLKCMAKENRK